MTLLSSLTNRIFLATALLAVVSIGVAIYNVNVAVTAQAERELRRGVAEAGTLVDEYRQLLFEHFSREARLVADLPRLKAAVALNDPPTVQPMAEEYQRQLDAHFVLIANPSGRVLGQVVSVTPAAAFAGLPGIRSAATGREASSFWPHTGGILHIVSVPIWIDPRQPEILGTLSVGFTLDSAAAARFKALTDSEIAFGSGGVIRASTLPQALWPSLASLLAQDGLTPAVRIGGHDYIALTRTLGQPAASGGAATAGEENATEASGVATIILRSRTDRLRFLASLHRTLGITALVAVLAATLLSYGIARTVTRPLGAITNAMREMTATGDLARRIDLPPGRWEDEDARLLATAFNRLADSTARFQREAAQRERLSSLGRLSTVVAHEIRNPLMIIKASLHALRRPEATAEQRQAAVADIDGEVGRLNRIVSEVLDFARPIRFDLAPVDLNALCRDAAQAAAHEAPDLPVRVQVDPAIGMVTTDAERLRLALVNILTNARHAVAARGDAQPSIPDPIRIVITRAERRIRIVVSDRGVGIAQEDMARVFDPYFTTRRTGTGLGLAISRNIIEGLGGTVSMSSRPAYGTDVTIELPAQD